MHFSDPLQTLSVELPSGWAYSPIESTLTDFYFTCWEQPENAVIVHVWPPCVDRDQPDEKWMEHIRSEMGEGASFRDLKIYGGSVVFAEFLTLKGAAQGVAFIRGARADIVVEQKGIDPNSSDLWSPLENAVMTASSSVNDESLERCGAEDFNACMKAANEAYEKKDIHALMDSLKNTLRVGMSAWLHSLAPPVYSPDFHAAIRTAQTMMNIAGITGSIVLPRDAESVLRRALVTLGNVGSESEAAQQLKTEIIEALRRISAELVEADEKNTDPDNPVLSLHERGFRFAKEAEEAFENKDLKDAFFLSSIAVDDLLALIAFLRRSPLKAVPEEIAADLASHGITDPAEQNETMQRAREALLYPPLSLSLKIRFYCAMESRDSKTAMDASAVMVRLAEVAFGTDAVTPGTRLNLAVSWISSAGAYILQDSAEGFRRAEEHLVKASQCLAPVKGQPCGEDSWTRFYRMQFDTVLQAIDQKLASGSPDSVDKLRSIRSQFETISAELNRILEN